MNITGGKYNSLNIETAKFDNVKPTLSKVRQAVFNSLANQGDFETFCDLFAGSGIMTFEAISRGYDVTSVEIDKRTSIFIKKNAEKHKIPINLINYDGIKFLQKTDKKFDVFYLDPPYQSGLYDKALEQIENRNLLNGNGIIVVEKPTELQINIGHFVCTKEKTYGDKSICYLKRG